MLRIKSRQSAQHRRNRPAHGGIADTQPMQSYRGTAKTQHRQHLSQLAFGLVRRDAGAGDALTLHAIGGAAEPGFNRPASGVTSDRSEVFAYRVMQPASDGVDIDG